MREIVCSINFYDLYVCMSRYFKQSSFNLYVQSMLFITRTMHELCAINVCCFSLPSVFNFCCIRMYWLYIIFELLLTFCLSSACIQHMTPYVLYVGRVPGVYEDWEECRR